MATGAAFVRIASAVLVTLSLFLGMVLCFYGPRWGVGVLILIAITVLLCLNSPIISDLTSAYGGGGGGLPVQQQQQPERVPRCGGGGLDASTIAALPAYAYGRKAGNDDDDDDCAVCLGELRPGEAVKQLPACAHLFHDGCVDAWLRSQATCPVCRFPVADAALPAVAEVVARVQE